MLRRTELDAKGGAKAKMEALVEALREIESAVVAYSGGVDSTLLLKAVRLSGIRALAVTACSETTPEHDLRDATRFAAEIGVEHRRLQGGEMQNEDFLNNTPDRCYHCKDSLFGALRSIAKAEGYGSVLDGSNGDDLADYRPGLRAAQKHGVRSPLVEAGMGKDEIREASRLLGLRSWDKPSSPCLSSRIPYGTRITPEALKRVSRSEGFVRSLGFGDVRVREHGVLARVEVPARDMERLVSLSNDVCAELKRLGYRFVSLDLEGLRSGSMNRTL